MVKLEASLILEILGRPKENVSSALQTVVDRLGQEKGVKLTNKKLHEPKSLENTDMFTAFAEVDVELDSIMTYLAVIFGHMPSNIQIMSPEKIVLNNLELNELGNSLVQRLHHYDSLAKNVLAERNFYAQKLKELAPELFQKQEPAMLPENKKRSTKRPKKN